MGGPSGGLCARGPGACGLGPHHLAKPPLRRRACRPLGDRRPLDAVEASQAALEARASVAGRPPPGLRRGRSAHRLPGRMGRRPRPGHRRDDPGLGDHPNTSGRGRGGGGHGASQGVASGAVDRAGRARRRSQGGACGRSNGHGRRPRSAAGGDHPLGGRLGRRRGVPTVVTEEGRRAVRAGG